MFQKNTLIKKAKPETKRVKRRPSWGRERPSRRLPAFVSVFAVVLIYVFFEKGKNLENKKKSYNEKNQPITLIKGPPNILKIFKTSRIESLKDNQLIGIVASLRQ